MQRVYYIDVELDEFVTEDPLGNVFQNHTAACMEAIRVLRDVMRGMEISLRTQVVTARVRNEDHNVIYTVALTSEVIALAT